MSEPDAAAPGASRWSDRREVARLVAGIVVILAFVALAALAIAASRSDLSISAPAASSQPAAAAPATRPDAPRLQPVSLPLLRSTPAAAPADPAADGPPEAEVAPPGSVPPLPDDGTAGVPCPQLGLPAPQEVGGLQSLVRLIPIFGPFSPEAFAMLPAFQPGIDALGPLFPVFASGLDDAAPVLDVVVPVVQQLGEQGFAALQPLYGPVREDVLAGERAFAAQLAPVVAALADAPGSECLVALEGVLAEALQPQA